ncbi:MAG: tetratricopeptide repeat protein [candidate division Zixibacteria bacterium]|nr:tetratricopeptide repeat protein [candidate division Zixibacteria bacterium]
MIMGNELKMSGFSIIRLTSDSLETRPTPDLQSCTDIWGQVKFLKHKTDKAFIKHNKYQLKGRQEIKQIITFCGLVIVLTFQISTAGTHKAADQGNAVAQYNLGQSYATGGGVSQDWAEAAKWYRKAADQGYAAAQLALGLIYANGSPDYPQSVRKDYAKFVTLLRKAADQGYSPAQIALGLKYYKGENVSQDHAEAVKWFRKAADQGDAEAKHYMDKYYDSQGVPRDNVEAEKWYRNVADRGDTAAQVALGLKYYNGEGVRQNFEEAVRWYKRAADQGCAAAQAALGSMYYEGTGGIPLDYGEAVKWYRKAADQGSSDAQNKLGVRYFKGEGVVRDYAESEKWFRMAADQGNADAQDNLEHVQAKRIPPAEISSWDMAVKKYDPGSFKNLILGGDEGVFICGYLEITQRLDAGEFLVSIQSPPRVFHCIIPSYVKLGNLVPGKIFKAIVRRGGIYEYVTTAGYKNSVETIEVLYAEKFR